MAKPTAEKIAALEARLKQQKARLTRLKAQETNAERKRDTRRKIIIGAAVMAHAAIDTTFAKALAQALDKGVTRDTDRALIADVMSGIVGGGTGSVPQA